MAKCCLHIINPLLPTIFLNNCYGQTTQDSTEQKMFLEIQKSHIDANIPDSSQFDILLNRDLEKYFSSKYGKVTIM